MTHAQDFRLAARLQIAGTGRCNPQSIATSRVFVGHAACDADALTNNANNNRVAQRTRPHDGSHFPGILLKEIGKRRAYLPVRSKLIIAQSLAVAWAAFSWYVALRMSGALRLAASTTLSERSPRFRIVFDTRPQALAATYGSRIPLLPEPSFGSRSVMTTSVMVGLVE